VFDAYEITGEVVKLDLLDRLSLKELYRRFRPSITFNLCGYGIDRSEQNERTAFATNHELIRTLCEVISATRDTNWKGQDIVNVGTAMEYGRASGNLDERTPPMPTTLYGRSKLAGTNALTEFSQKLKIKGVTARLFSVYGPGESSGRLLPTLIRSVQEADDIPLSPGLHRRDFTYVEDVAECLLRLGLTAAEPGDVVNAATGKLSTVRSFVETAARILGISDRRLAFGALPTRPEEMHHSPVAIERMRRLIQWEPRTSIETGIRRTVRWYQVASIDQCRSVSDRAIAYRT
jgi:nucleoside-diphosphate-sugar epimerase